MLVGDMPVSRLRKDRRAFSEKRPKYIGSGPEPRDVPRLGMPAAALALWFVFAKDAYGLAFGLLVLLPVVWLVWRGAGRKPYTTSLVNGDKKPDIDSVPGWLVWPSFALMVGVLYEFNVENFYRGVLVYCCTLGVVLVVLMTTHQWPQQMTAKRARQHFILFIVLSMYSIGTGIGLNCYADPSADDVHQVAILRKYIDNERKYRRKHDDYILVLEGWGGMRGREVLVDRKVYESLEEGELVEVHSRKGLFGMGWGYVVKWGEKIGD